MEGGGAMKKKWAVRLGMLLAWAALLCWLTVRTGDVPALLGGNLVSFLPSYWFTVTAKWRSGAGASNRSPLRDF